MNNETRTSLPAFADWIRATDDHAEHHLALIARTEQALAAHDTSVGSPQNLSEKIERWRYHYMHEHAGELSAREEEFLDTLDLTANQLAGRPDRIPRRTRHAVQNESLDTDAIQEAIEAMDPQYPLEWSCRRAAELTEANFRLPVPGQPHAALRRRMLLYAPLYVSSHCVNFCTYCGFRYPLDIQRRHLTVDEALDQIWLLRDLGFRHILIVGGEYPQLTTTSYYCAIAQAAAGEGLVPAVEIAPQSTDSYAALATVGVCGVTLYQETYDRRLYGTYHLRGPKSNYHGRLEALDRAAEAGMSRLGLGVLLGLADPRREILAMMRHGAYLGDRFPDRTLAFSLPRIHEAPEGFASAHLASDEQLIRGYCALRIAFPQAELVLSTRERSELRNRLAPICITQMSAGSSTAPGGYGEDTTAGSEQFPVADHRGPDEVAQWLEQSNFRVAWSIEPAAAPVAPS